MDEKKTEKLKKRKDEKLEKRKDKKLEESNMRRELKRRDDY